MQRAALLALAARSFTSAVQHNNHRHAHHHQGLEKRQTPASLIKVASASYLCDVKSDLPIVRDLGFVGKIADTIVYTYGDSQTSSNDPNWWMTSDSSSISSGDPCYVLNTQRVSDGSHQTDLIAPQSQWGETNTEYGFGASTVIPTEGNEGMVFYSVNHRPNGQQTILGSGVAKVMLNGNNITTERQEQYWWDNVNDGIPKYGEGGAYSNGKTLWGIGKGGPSPSYIYLNRVKVSDWDNKEAYEYFDGSTGTWGSTPLSNPTAEQALQWNNADGATWAVAWGQPIWSPYFNKILWVYTDSFTGRPQQVLARTADHMRGPWSAETVLYTVDPLEENGVANFVYCSVANPYYDPSGKSIIVTIDNGAATIQATKVTFA